MGKGLILMLEGNSKFFIFLIDFFVKFSSCFLVTLEVYFDLIDIPIPGNDDAVRSIKLIVNSLTDSIIKGQANPASGNY